MKFFKLKGHLQIPQVFLDEISNYRTNKSAMVGKIEETVIESEKHNGEVTCLIFYNEHLFSGGSDGIIKLWDKDLTLIKDIPAHPDQVTALAMSENGELYSSGREGTIKYFKEPFKSSEGKEIFRAYKEGQEIVSLFCSDDGNLYAGDLSGIVTKFVNNQANATYKVGEEAKSMAVEHHNLYTAKDLDTLVTQLVPGKKGNCGLIATIEGRAPLALVDPNEYGHSKYLVFTTRDGKGVTLVRNVTSYPVVWKKEVSRH